MGRVAIGVLAVVLGGVVPAYSAETSRKMIGVWEVRTSEDKFADHKRVTALRVHDLWGLGVRCFPSGLSVALLSLRSFPAIEDGDEVKVLFRADKKDIVKTIGTALGDDVFQLDDSEKIISEMVGASSYAFRITIGVTAIDLNFKAGKGADAAIKEVTSACEDKK